MALRSLLIAVMLSPASAADPWRAESASEAANLTSIEGPAPNDCYEDLSGAFCNSKQQRLWLCRNGGATGSKFWAVVKVDRGSWQVEHRAGRRGVWTGFDDLEDITLTSSPRTLPALT
jgi:hypothetical protein